MFAGWMDDLPKQATAFIYNVSSLHQSCQKAAAHTKSPIQTCVAETGPLSPPPLSHFSSCGESGPQQHRRPAQIKRGRGQAAPKDRTGALADPACAVSHNLLRDYL